MKLAAYTGTPSAVVDIQDVRNLTVEEIKLEAVYRPVVIEARSRFKLFRVLEQNHQDWAAYVKSLLHPEPLDHDTATFHLNRLLFNYLNCAYALRAHFESSFHQRFRADGAEQKKYKSLQDALIQKSWPFAFFLDFRHYLNLTGLGLGHYQRTLTATSVALEITHTASDLLNTTKDWPRSRLAPGKGVLEMVPLLADFHAQMMQHYSDIVVQTLFAELVPADELFQKLGVEAQKAKPGHKLALLDGDRPLFPPADLSTELGVSLKAGK